MAASDMMSALMELCQEKHIDQLYLIDRLEQSLAKSYAEILHLEWGAKVTIDRTTGKIYVYEPHRCPARQGRDQRHRAQLRPRADLRGVLRPHR